MVVIRHGQAGDLVQNHVELAPNLNPDHAPILRLNMVVLPVPVQALQHRTAIPTTVRVSFHIFH